MTAAQAVVVGASIALVGSIVGGFISPLILALIAGRRAKASLELERKKERHEALRLAIREFLEALLELSVVDRDSVETRTAIKRAMMTSLDFGLLLEQRDQPLAVAISSSTDKVAASSPLTSAIIEALTSVLPGWHRGWLTGREALLAYREKSGDPALVENLPDE